MPVMSTLFLPTVLIMCLFSGPDVNTVIHTPKNTVPVELYFRGEKLAKVSEKRENISPKYNNSKLMPSIWMLYRQWAA